MSDNSPSTRPESGKRSDGHLRLGFPLKNRTRIGGCLRDAFDRVADEKIPDEFEELLGKLN